MDVKEIVGQWLKDHGYDGLWNDLGECGCEVGDLCPCQDGNIGDCQPGYKHAGNGDYAFFIKPEKGEG